MIREIDLVSYLPPFMRKYREPVAALEAENPEFAVAWDRVGRTLRNLFIASADETGISRFEKILKITPLDTDSLEARRARVQSRWANFVPYTKGVMVHKATELLGGEHKFSLRTDFEDGYRMEMEVYSTDETLTDELRHLLSVMLPSNIVAEIIYVPVTDRLLIYCGEVMEQADIVEIRQR